MTTNQPPTGRALAAYFDDLGGTTTSDADTTFNAEYVELVWGEADSVQRRLLQLADDCRFSARHPQRSDADDTTVARLLGQEQAYRHAVEMLDLAFDQALARVARQASA